MKKILIALLICVITLAGYILYSNEKTPVRETGCYKYNWNDMYDYLDSFDKNHFLCADYGSFYSRNGDTCIGYFHRTGNTCSDAYGTEHYLVIDLLRKKKLYSCYDVDRDSKVKPCEDYSSYWLAELNNN